MITRQEIAILQDEQVQETIRRYGESDPARVALTLPEHGALIATQIKYLQRARTKLPSYYAAGCILPGVSFEQCSSEMTAAAKTYSGELCIDLTCGLGVDAAHFARHFTRVIALERNPVLSEVARINFMRLGIQNIEVVEQAAEDFLETHPALTADLIYVDPDRRGSDGNRVFLLEDCSPNVLALLPQLRRMAPQIVIKASPLFDVEEAFRLFGAGITVEVVSLQGECKEVLIEISRASGEVGWIKTTIAGGASLTFAHHSEAGPISEFAPPYRYLVIPDVSLYKARLVGRYAASAGMYAPSGVGYCFANEVPKSLFGRFFTIQEILPYRPKELKSRFKSAGIKRCTILKKDFPLEADAIARALGVGEGGPLHVAFTQIKGQRYAILLA